MSQASITVLYFVVFCFLLLAIYSRRQVFTDNTKRALNEPEMHFARGLANFTKLYIFELR